MNAAEEPFPGSPDDMMNTVAALRAQNAELVAALVRARDELESWYDAKNVLATISAALAAAGHKQGSGE
jgi:hypothetical protein